MSLIQAYVYGITSGIGNSLYKTEDSGQTWSEINSFAPYIPGTYGALHVHKYNRLKVFFAGENPAGTTPVIVRS